jgi:UDP-GlcNAc:undecaprenyl-phosphate GlcNAc-1-phosphate transferase
VLWSLQSTSPWGLAPPLILLAIPLLDVALAVARRFLTHQSIFSPDKSHIHHQLLKQGFSAKRAALALYACCGFLAALSLLWSAPPERFSGAIIVVFCAALWLGIQRLGYIEFVEAWKLVRQRGFEDVRDALSLSGKP